MPIFEVPLDAVEVRVLACLLEKEITTPEYYPLTLNALVNACNQKSNRDPVVQYDENVVLEALSRLRSRKLVMELIPAGSRVHKYEHRISEVLNLGRRELAVLCTLMLRGPQTAGEIHARSLRMHAFTGLDEVEAVLARLMSLEPEPLAVKLPRLPGTKEPRYTHLLAGEPDVTALAGAAALEAPVTAGNEIAELREEMARLREEVDELRRDLADLRRLFE